MLENSRMAQRIFPTPSTIPPCFLRGTLVEVPSGDENVYRRFVPIETLKEGDKVVTEDGRIVGVQYVVQLQLPTAVSCPLDDDLTVTLPQPVRRIQERISRIRNPWSFAKDLRRLGRVPTDEMGWNLVLQDGGSMIRTRRWECVTLGHGIVDNDVTADSYWGTQSVVNDYEYFQKRE